MQELLHVSFRLAVLDRVFLFDNGDQFGKALGRFQRLPDQRAGLVEAVDGGEVSDFAAHGNDQGLSGDAAGDHRLRAHKDLLKMRRGKVFNEFRLS